jgi:hypothetical protein
MRVQVVRLNQRAIVLGERLREAWLNDDAVNWSLLRDELTQVENRIRELEEAIADRG